MLELSALNHTWFIDIDGTIFEHNAYLNGKDIILPGVKNFWDQIPNDDVIILITARSSKHASMTLKSLGDNLLRFDHILFDLPSGERIIINDKKPSGLTCAFALSLTRNSGLENLKIVVNSNL